MPEEKISDPMKLSAMIGKYISSCAPVIGYTERDVREALGGFSEDDLAQMRECGLLGDDFELFYVIRRFCSRIGLTEIAPAEYVISLFENAKKFSPSEFENDPFIRAVAARIKEKKKGNILLTNASYDRGEIFQYAPPELASGAPDRAVLKLGFCTGKVYFPTVYENEMPWMSACPSEINSMKEQTAAAHGRVLVLGLGLGYYPFSVSLREEVSSITIVELNPDVISLFNSEIFPCFGKKQREKIRIVRADAIDYLKGVGEDDFDFCFADIWEGILDGAEAVKKIRPYEKKLPKTEFTYWIGEQIRAYLEEE